jgi:nitrogen fixation protein FixH
MKKLNWGHSIFFIYSAFVVAILFMVYQSTQQTYDLVEKDYYAAELKYQDVIDASARAKALGGDFIVKYESDSIKLILPSPFKGVNVVGKVQLYFAADKQQDKTYEFETLNAYAAFKTEKQNKGLYTIKLDIVKSGVAYYYEQKIYL